MTFMASGFTGLGICVRFSGYNSNKIHIFMSVFQSSGMKTKSSCLGLTV